MRTWPLISLVQASVISALLSGCLVSKAPLITAANSDRLPFPPHVILSNGTPEKAAMDLADDNSYIISSVPTEDKKSDPFEEKVYFKKISENTYAYSRREIDKDTGAVLRYTYGYMRIVGSDKMATREPDCSTFDPVELKKLGVETIEADPNDKFSSTSCNVPSVSVLETLLRSYLDDPRNAEKIKHDEDQSALIVISR